MIIFKLLMVILGGGILSSYFFFKCFLVLFEFLTSACSSYPKNKTKIRELKDLSKKREKCKGCEVGKNMTYLKVKKIGISRMCDGEEEWNEGVCRIRI